MSSSPTRPPPAPTTSWASSGRPTGASSATALLPLRSPGRKHRRATRHRRATPRTMRRRTLNPVLSRLQVRPNRRRLRRRHRPRPRLRYPPQRPRRRRLVPWPTPLVPARQARQPREVARTAARRAAPPGEDPGQPPAGPSDGAAEQASQPVAVAEPSGSLHSISSDVWSGFASPSSSAADVPSLIGSPATNRAAETSGLRLGLALLALGSAGLLGGGFAALRTRRRTVA